MVELGHLVTRPVQVVPHVHLASVVLVEVPVLEGVRVYLKYLDLGIWALVGFPVLFLLKIRDQHLLFNTLNY
jgi:hypothetical protein